MSHFFAYLARMRFIGRWGLMHSTRAENIQEHSQRVAMLAHALGLVRNRLFAGGVDGGLDDRKEQRKERHGDERKLDGCGALLVATEGTEDLLLRGRDGWRGHPWIFPLSPEGTDS